MPRKKHVATQYQYILNTPEVIILRTANNHECCKGIRAARELRILHRLQTYKIHGCSIVQNNFDLL